MRRSGTGAFACVWDNRMVCVRRVGFIRCIVLSSSYSINEWNVKGTRRQAVIMVNEFEDEKNSRNSLSSRHDLLVVAWAGQCRTLER